MRDQICLNQPKGLGDPDFRMAVYIANIPAMAEYQYLQHIQPLASGEIQAIGQSCGNGWRKVFNVYAKLLFALDAQHFDFSRQASSWQQYREQKLLQSASQTALLFGLPGLANEQQAIRIICGKTHGQQCVELFGLDWLDNYFAISHEHNVIICPYFDYRQLTNERIVGLAQLIKQLKVRNR